MSNRLKLIKKHILFCSSDHCNGQNVEDIMEEFKAQFVEHGIHKEIKMSKTSCLGMCGNGPFALIYPEGVWYYNLTVEDVPRIIQEHFIDGVPVQELVLMKMGND